MIRFQCDCGKSLQAKEEYTGQLTRCPDCGRELPIPGDKNRIQADVPPERERPPESLRTERQESDRRSDRGRDDRPTAAQRTSGKAVAALILGILSVLGCTLLTGLPAMLLGLLGLLDANRGRAGRKGLAITGLVLGALGTFLVGPLLLLYAYKKVGEATARVQSSNNVKEMMLAMHYHHEATGSFPAHHIVDPKDEAKPLLSWRVAILPYVEASPLYSQFKLDEPWDGPNNSRLISQMPAYYKVPGVPEPPAGYTYYRVFASKPSTFLSVATALDPSSLQPFRGPRLTDITDGASNTIVVVEADQAVPWTKPDELPFDPNGPVTGIGNLRNGNPIVVGLADGTVRMLDVKKLSPATLKAAITRNGNENMGPDW